VFGSVELKTSISNEVTLPVPQFTSQPVSLEATECNLRLHLDFLCLRYYRSLPAI
jgi:hypothetical protein